jgi:hypothetical protein
MAVRFRRQLTFAPLQLVLPRCKDFCDRCASKIILISKITLSMSNFSAVAGDFLTKGWQRLAFFLVVSTLVTFTGNQESYGTRI